ncbi:MAG TPA: hypothetical protein VFE59_39385 [Trebonia sp.]|nr:hypothetical protein [Trebonia sp.]
MATLNDFHSPRLALEATIAALAAAGAIPADGSAAAARAVAAALRPGGVSPGGFPVSCPGHGARCSHAGAGPAARSLPSRSAPSPHHSTA